MKRKKRTHTIAWSAVLERHFWFQDNLTLGKWLLTTITPTIHFKALSFDNLHTCPLNMESNQFNVRYLFISISGCVISGPRHCQVSLPTLLNSMASWHQHHGSIQSQCLAGHSFSQHGWEVTRWKKRLEMKWDVIKQTDNPSSEKSYFKVPTILMRRRKHEISPLLPQIGRGSLVFGYKNCGNKKNNEKRNNNNNKKKKNVVLLKTLKKCFLQIIKLYWWSFNISVYQLYWVLIWPLLAALTFSQDRGVCVCVLGSVTFSGV